MCGGLTTLSTFAVEAIQLVMSSKHRAALMSVSENLVWGIAAAPIGLAIALAMQFAS